MRTKSIDTKKCRRNFIWLSVYTLLWSLPLIVMVTDIFPAEGLPPIIFSATFFPGLLASLLQLGRLAVLNNQNFIGWLILPLFCPLLGQVIAYILMWRLGKRNGWA